MGSDFDKKRQRNASGESTISNDSVSNYIPTPPDGGYGWIIVLASFMNHVVVDGVTYTFGVFYLEFLEHFKAGKSKTALVGSLLCGFYLMTGPIASALVNRYGCRPVCIAGSIIASAAFVLSTLSQDIYVMMLTYGCMGGFGFGLIYLPSIISVSYYFEKRRAVATGIAVCGAGVGGFIFAPFGRYLLATLHWKMSMYVLSTILIISLVCGCLMSPLETRKKPRRKNLLDRVREKLCGSSDKQTEQAESAGSSESDIAKAVEEAKLMREQRLHDEEEMFPGRQYSLLPISTTPDPSRQSSIVPATVLEVPQIRIQSVSTELPSPEEENAKAPPRDACEDDANMEGQDETSQMIKNSTTKLEDVREGETSNTFQSSSPTTTPTSDTLVDSSKLNSETDTYSKTSPRGSTSSASALPPHIRRMMANGSMAGKPPPHPTSQLNGILKAQNTRQCSLPEGKPLLQDNINNHLDLLHVDNSQLKSISVSDVLALGIPRARVKRPENIAKEDFARPLYR